LKGKKMAKIFKLVKRNFCEKKVLLTWKSKVKNSLSVKNNNKEVHLLEDEGLN
jgi:hypothetical protein